MNVSTQRNNDLRADVWGRYWAQGTEQSVSDGILDAPGSSAHDFWRDVAAPWTPGHRVLEIGAGNGALTRLLVAVTRHAGAPEIDAVDLALVHPGWLDHFDRRLANIRFHTRCDAAALPFPDDAFDAAVGQFSIEYTDQRATVAELRRCCRPGSRLAFVTHHAESAICGTAGDEHAEMRWLLDASGLYEAIDELAPFLSGRAGPAAAELNANEQAVRARGRYNAAQRAIQARAARCRTPESLELAARGAAAVLAVCQRHGVAQASALMARQMEALEDACWRLEDLLAHALDTQGVRRLTGYLTRAGFGDVQVGELMSERRCLAWTVTARG